LTGAADVKYITPWLTQTPVGHQPTRLFSIALLGNQGVQQLAPMHKSSLNRQNHFRHLILSPPPSQYFRKTASFWYLHLQAA